MPTRQGQRQTPDRPLQIQASSSRVRPLRLLDLRSQESPTARTPAATVSSPLHYRVDRPSVRELLQLPDPGPIRQTGQSRRISSGWENSASEANSEDQRHETVRLLAEVPYLWPSPTHSSS